MFSRKAKVDKNLTHKERILQILQVFFSFCFSEPQIRTVIKRVPKHSKSRLALENRSMIVIPKGPTEFDGENSGPSFVFNHEAMREVLHVLWPCSALMAFDQLFF